MLILMKTYSTSEYEKEDYDLAIADIGESDAKYLATLMNGFKEAREKSPDLIFSHFKATVRAAFFRESLFEGDELDELLDDMEDNGWIEIPKDIELPFEESDAQDPELLHLLLTDEGFAWRAFPEGSDVTIDTETVPYSVLSQLI